MKVFYSTNEQYCLRLAYNLTKFLNCITQLNTPELTNNLKSLSLIQEIVTDISLSVQTAALTSKLVTRKHKQ